MPASKHRHKRNQKHVKRPGRQRLEPLTEGFHAGPDGAPVFVMPESWIKENAELDARTAQWKKTLAADDLAELEAAQAIYDRAHGPHALRGTAVDLDDAYDALLALKCRLGAPGTEIPGAASKPSDEDEASPP